MSDQRDAAGKHPDGDRAVPVALGPIEPLSEGFRRYERHHYVMAGPDGSPRDYDRDVLRAGAVVGVLPIDLARREVVLIRQFRLAAHLATGRGELVELVAGRVDRGESARDCAMRECLEEIGLTPKRIAVLMTLLVAPAFADEVMTLFVADVDSTTLPAMGGKADEGEVIAPFRVSFDAALHMMERGRADVHAADRRVAVARAESGKPRMRLRCVRREPDRAARVQSVTGVTHGRARARCRGAERDRARWLAGRRGRR